MSHLLSELIFVRLYNDIACNMLLFVCFVLVQTESQAKGHL